MDIHRKTEMARNKVFAVKKVHFYNPFYKIYFEVPITNWSFFLFVETFVRKRSDLNMKDFDRTLKEREVRCGEIQ